MRLVDVSDVRVVFCNSCEWLFGLERPTVNRNTVGCRCMVGVHLGSFQVSWDVAGVTRGDRNWARKLV